MSFLFSASRNLARCLGPSTPFRPIFTTASLKIKEIRIENKDGNVIVEGVTLPSPRKELLVKPKITEILAEHNCKPVCYLCALGLDVKHTDVLILSQFLRSDGCMLPRRITGLCSRQQLKVTKLVAMAQKAGLMINITPENCKKDPKSRFAYKKFNTYYDEATIFGKKPPKWTDRFKYRERAK